MIIDQLFVAYGSHRKGKKVSKQTLARWFSLVIRNAYDRMGRQDPVHTNPHSARGVAASWAELAGVGMPAICEAATWSSTLSFATYYRLDFAGRSVSSALLRLASPCIHLFHTCWWGSGGRWGSIPLARGTLWPVLCVHMRAITLPLHYIKSQ